MIIRCPKCNKLLLKGELRGYLRLEIICPKCRFRVVAEINTHEYTVKSFKRRKYKKINNFNSKLKER